MIIGSNSNGRVCSKDNEENQCNNDNKENETSAALQGDDGTANPGDPLLPRQIFCPSNISTPSSISALSMIDLTVDIDLHQPRQSATVHDQIAEDTNQSHMSCSVLLHDANLCHVKRDKEEQDGGDRSCAGAAKFEEHLHVKRTVSDTGSQAARFNEPTTASKQTCFVHSC
jgi:hypothetical protein